MRSKRRRSGAAAAACAALLTIAGGLATADEPSAALVDAFHSAIAQKTGHLRRSLEEKDFKSLAQSAGGLELLAEVLRTGGDDAAWQAAVGPVLAAAKKVRDAASDNSEQQAQAAIKELDAACSAAKAANPAGKALEPPKAELRPLMMLIDGVYADAKISIMTGKPQDAKKGAYVLSELGRLVSNLRGGGRTQEQWTHLGGLFTAAALEAARSEAEDAVEVRLLLRSVAERCDACHNAQ